jgi:hypothetical protein
VLAREIIEELEAAIGEMQAVLKSLETPQT